MKENFDYPFYMQLEKEKQKYETRKGIRKLGFSAGMCVLLYVCLSYVFGALLSVTGLTELASKSDVVNHAFGIVISFVCIFVPFFIISLSKRNNILETISFEKPTSSKSSAQLISGGFGLCILASLTVSIIATVLSLLGYNPSLGVAQVPMGTTVFGFVLYSLKTAVVPALIEEFAIRGVLMQPLRKYGDTFAIVMSSLVFAVMHGEFIQGIFAFLAGVVLGYIVVATGTIWTGVIVHFMNNMFSVVISAIGLTSVLASNIVYWVVVVTAEIVAFVVLKKYFYSGGAYRPKKVETGLSGIQKFCAYIFNLPIIAAIIILAISIIQSLG